jgi:hypothetical protein
MATSPSHKFGQLIGNLIEEVMIEYLKPISDRYGLYLDHKHPRPARNGNREVIWKDVNDNQHKLDIVLEEGGSEDTLGNPRAFIEIAWRRYTKHSKNKAQEIAGAIVPLISRHKKYAPFYGSVVAGEFTENSLDQLVSEGFNVVYFEMDTIVQAFRTVGLDAHWEENTSHEVLLSKVEQYEQLSNVHIATVKAELIRLNSDELDRFTNKLEECLSRTIARVKVYSLHGMLMDLTSARAAYDYIQTYNEDSCNVPLVKYEIAIEYNNGDRIDVQFRDKQNALVFLAEYI